MVIIAGKGSEDFQEIASQLPDGNWAMLRVSIATIAPSPVPVVAVLTPPPGHTCIRSLMSLAVHACVVFWGMTAQAVPNLSISLLP